MKLLRFAGATLILAYHSGLGQAATAEGQIQKFTPSTNPFAHRIVIAQFSLVNDLKKIDPEVLNLFYSKVRPDYIANRGEPFNSTDVIVNDHPARRFVLAGSAQGIWFILYEHGGVAYHHDLVVFSKNGHWQIAAVVQGAMKGESDFESLKQAIKAGQFFSQPGPPQF